QSLPAFPNQSLFDFSGGFSHNYHPTLVMKSSGFITSKVQSLLRMLTESSVVLNLFVTPSSQDKKYWASPSKALAACNASRGDSLKFLIISFAIVNVSGVAA